MLRSTLTIERHSYGLAQNADIDALRTAMEQAIEAGGRFVDVTIAGNATLSIFIGPGFPIFLTTEEIPEHDRDPGDRPREYSDFDWEVGDLFV